MAEKDQLESLVEMLIPTMNSTRERRKFIENEWLQNYRAWQGWPSQTYLIRLPDNAIHYFIPHARRAIERNVSRGTKLLMPNMDWHQTLPFDGISHQNAEAVHNALRYIYQKKIPTKKNISSGLRCLQMFNFSILHTSAIIQKKEVWPYQRSVDPFNFYVFPDTASNIEEATVIFEDSIIPYQVYLSYVDRSDKSKSLYEYIEAEDLHSPVWPYHLIERLAYRGLTQPSDLVQGTGKTRKLTEKSFRESREKASETLAMKGKTFVALSKVYFRLDSRWFFAVLCTNIQDSGEGGYNTKVVRLDESENEPLYRWTNSRPLPDELYTNSPTDDIRVLQNLTNNALSQVESNRSRFAEPPMVANASKIGRLEQKTFENRKLWLFEDDPKDAIMSLDVEDTSTNGIRALQIYKGMLDQNSGGGLPEGQPGRNMPRAGFAANTLLNMSLTDVEDIADFYEQECLTPGIGDVYHILLEYVPDSQIIKIPNKHPQLVKAYKKKDLFGDYSFTWLGSLGFQDTQVRADKFSQFLGMLFNPQIFQVLSQQLAQQGLKIDIASILKTYYSYGLGERGLGEIIIEMSDQERQALNQPSPEQQMQQQELQQKQQESQQKMQIEGMKAQTGIQKGKLDLQKTQMEMQKAQVEGDIDVKSKQMDMQNKQMDAVMSYLSSLGALSSNGAGDERK